MGRRTVLLLTLATLLAMPASSSAATPTFKLRAPNAGDVAVAHVTFKARGAARLVVTNRGALPDDVLAVGGVRKLSRGRRLASLVLVRASATGASDARASAASSAVARIRVRSFRGFVRKQLATNIVTSSGKPPFCGSLPRSFSYVGRAPLAGSLVPGYDARTTARLAYLLGCKDVGGGADFVQAIGGEGGGGSGGRNTGGAPECEFDDTCEEDGEQAPTVSTTLEGSGTVTRDASDPNLFTYAISFDEPVNGYRIEVPKTNIRCPTRYGDWIEECRALGNSNSTAADGVALACEPGPFTHQFQCETGSGERSPGTQRPTIPAGTTISGRFKIDAGSVGPGGVRVTGLQGENTESQPATLSGP